MTHDLFIISLESAAQSITGCFQVTTRESGSVVIKEESYPDSLWTRSSDANEELRSWRL
ncbi:hypothetical protein AVEN_213917-1, partial [Araneus ventricosus]